MPAFSHVSAARLATCHPNLQKIFNELIKTVDCSIICGHRSEVEQEHAFETGASKLDWPFSAHNSVPSHAVDVMPYPIDWEDLDGVSAFADEVLACAERLGIPLTWGGSWGNFPDRDHYQLK